MRQLPWEYLFKRFDVHTFHDIYTPTWVATIVLLVALVVLSIGLLGVAGMLIIMTASGVFIGYWQARAGYVGRTHGAIRFLK